MLLLEGQALHPHISLYPRGLGTVTGLPEGVALYPRGQSGTGGGSGSVPGQPSFLSVVPGDTILTISFAPPEDDGGSPITDYMLYRYDSVEGWQGESVGTSSPVVLTGAVNQQWCQFMLAAVNSNGMGDLGTGISISNVASDMVTVSDGPEVYRGLYGVDVSSVAPGFEGDLPLLSLLTGLLSVIGPVMGYDEGWCIYQRDSIGSGPVATNAAGPGTPPATGWV